MVEIGSCQRLADGLDAHSPDAVEAYTQQLESCIDANMPSSAVVALNAGFESVLQETLIKELHEHDTYLSQQRIEELEEGNVPYHSMLEEANERNIINNQLHELLDGIRDERNRYVHTDSRAVSRADVDEHGDLATGYEVYHDILEETGRQWFGEERFFLCEKPGSIARAAC